MATTPAISAHGLSVGYGDTAVLADLDFEVARGDVFVVMGGSGSGKSTLLRHLIGLAEPIGGEIWYGGRLFTGADPDERSAIARGFGVLFQSGALWSSMTLIENVSLPLEELTDLPPREIEALARFKLRLVGLAGFETYYPSQISGGMQKRAALARAMALDPEVLFLDEPSAGLDPLTARRLDDLILELRDSLGVTVVIVTHELASIFAIASNSIFVDGKTRSILARGDPRALRDASPDALVRSFLTRGDITP
jgi:phospholipid/cholesterol/gamma-HCH transport system ATP-binding protein